jgi:hypothetical protein
MRADSATVRAQGPSSRHVPAADVEALWARLDRAFEERSRPVRRVEIRRGWLSRLFA